MIDSMMNNKILTDENKIKDDDNKIDKDKKSNRSNKSNAMLLKDVLIYNENEKKILEEMNNQNVGNPNEFIDQKGYIEEA